MATLTVTALNTNYSEIPTGDMDMSAADFIRKNGLIHNEDGTFSAEWGNGEGSDDFDIQEHNSPTHPAVETVEDSAEIETNGVLVGEEAMEIECATCGKLFWSLDSDHVECDACDEAAADFESDMRLNETLIGTEKIDRGPYMTVTIPFCDEHAGILSRIVTLEWICPTCGGPRGKPHDAVSFDGSLRLYCHGWSNPCGHVDKYEDVRKEADAMIAPKPVTRIVHDTAVMILERENKRLQDEIAQLKDERDTLKVNLADKRTTRDEIEDDGPTDGPDAWGNFNIDEEDSFDPWEDERYQDRGEAGKGIFFG